LNFFHLAAIVVVFLIFYIILSEKIERKLALLISLSSGFLFYFYLKENLITLLKDLFFSLIVFFFFYVLLAFYYSIKQYNKEKVELDQEFYKNKFLRIALVLAFSYFLIKLIELINFNYNLLRALFTFLVTGLIGLMVFYFVKKG
jgi:hypothetical protein